MGHAYNNGRDPYLLHSDGSPAPQWSRGGCWSPRPGKRHAFLGWTTGVLVLEDQGGCLATNMTWAESRMIEKTKTVRVMRDQR